MKTRVRTRIAPSPTGSLHIGTARTALFNWLFTRKEGGEFILRIEDTDKERSERKYEEEIIGGLEWLGLKWDEGPDAGGKYGPYRQSERQSIYKKEIEKLLANGSLYYCFCTKEELEVARQAQLSQGLNPKYSRKCRNLSNEAVRRKIKEGLPSVLRFKTPDDVRITFTDIIRGPVEFNSDTLGDIVVARDAENPLFTLAGVIDDAYMEITHVIRGEDHLPNTPKQILLQEAMGFKKPTYAHLPLILSSDRKKLSKRLAETSLLEYKKQGYLSAAMVNFIALIGWHPISDQEIFGIAELTKEFDLKRVQKAGAIFDMEKLNWINSEYIKKLGAKELISNLAGIVPPSWLKDKALFAKAAALEQTRLKTLSDFLSSAKFFFELPPYDAPMLVWTKKGNDKNTAAEALQRADNALSDTQESRFNKKNLEDVIAGLLDPADRGAFLWPLRVALAGQSVSPGPYEIMEVLGKQESLRRIRRAVEILKVK